METCTSEFTAFREYKARCERGEGHLGDHEQVVGDRLMVWSFDGAGGSAARLENYSGTCSECMSRMQSHEANDGGVCNSCAYYRNIYESYIRGTVIVHKGRIHAKHHRDSPQGGYANSVFTVEYPDGTTTINQLVGLGSVPPWYSERMPNNAVIFLDQKESF